MKKILMTICFAVAAMAAVSCDVTENGNEPEVKDPFTISSPSPTEPVSRVELTEAQQGYVRAGNGMAFRLMDQLYKGESLVCSPLSLQYALAMTANGASDETLQEIIDFLGYGDDGIDALNEYCRILLEQLPAVDLDVKLKVTDALLVNDNFPLLPDFRQKMEDYYYAAVDNMDFSDPDQVAARINEWARRSTDGFIDKVLDRRDISDLAAAFLMNALYFKAKWAGGKYDPMFEKEFTAKEDFTLPDGSKKKVDMMPTESRFAYGEFEGFRALALPYAGGKFHMYFLLPDGNDPAALTKALKEVSWNDILSSLKTDSKVYVKIPKFSIENKLNLNDDLQELGIKKAFRRGADFYDMFVPHDGYYFWIGSVIQKAKIAVAEWGTEAAAVTVVQMYGENAMHEEEPPKYFYADHPFAFIIGEAGSGTILFEGVYTGK